MNSFKTEKILKTRCGDFVYFDLKAFEKETGKDLSKLPFSLRVLLENLLRTEDGVSVTREDILALADWKPRDKPSKEIAFTPARVILQDFTGVPAVVDLAAMRDAVERLGGNPGSINPLQAVDLVIDHSVQVDHFGTAEALKQNTDIEFGRNRERYEFLKWGQKAFKNFRAVPPGQGIVHQVNLEYLASVVFTKPVQGAVLAYPDSLVGTDSHTTMINGLGVLGWGVGGIEAEAAMLGQPISMLIPQVVGFKLTGKFSEGVTATDLVLQVVEMLRQKGVVGKFVEFYGEGVNALALADRATLANMAPEYGATMGFFPVDSRTTDYLKLTARTAEQVDLVETYLKAQDLFRTSESKDPEFSDTLELDIASVVPSIAGPKRPQDRIELKKSASAFGELLKSTKPEAYSEKAGDGVEDGSVVIAAITSCTNTSNPSVMLAAGLLAKKAAEKGLKSKPWVKTSLAPGSRVVNRYLEKSGLSESLKEVGFYTVGFGCTTCIGNSGPLSAPVAQAIGKNDLMVASVLSGNRNFEGRVNPLVKTNYLASPPLVVAYALAGTMKIDFEKDPIGKDSEGVDVYLKDLWPTNEEIESLQTAVTSDMFQKEYGTAFDGDESWQRLTASDAVTYPWDEASTYVKHPPYFEGMTLEVPPTKELGACRVLAVLGDSVTTDHISPAGAIAKDGPAARYLKEHGVDATDFNSFGSRRGNHEVMMRGTFANIRLRNLLAPGTEGGATRHLPAGEEMSIFDAAMKYKAEGTPLIVIAGKEYGSGSSRDWAAKGPALLGVRAVIAESYERIHRSNLIGMGILPFQFMEGESRETLGLTGEELYSFEGLENLAPGKLLKCKAGDKSFQILARIDTPVELEYYQHGGILQFVLRGLLKK